MSIIDPTTDTIETVPPIECFPWCTYRDGHPNEVDPEDQWCQTPSTLIDASWYEDQPPVELDVYAVQGADDDNPVVHVDRNGQNDFIGTVETARELAEALAATIATVEDVPSRTVLEPLLDLSVSNTVDLELKLPIVHLRAAWPTDGHWGFIPSEARALAFALLAHAARAEARYEECRGPSGSASTRCPT